MKKMLISLVFLMMLVGIASAESSLATTASVNIGITEMVIGTAYDINGKQLLAIATLPVIGYKDYVDVSVGILTNITDHAVPLASIDLNIQGITTALGLTYKLLDPLKVGVFYGRDLAKVSTVTESTEYYGVSWNIVWKF
jgi:hypothetical protein